MLRLHPTLLMAIALSACAPPPPQAPAVSSTPSPEATATPTTVPSTQPIPTGALEGRLYDDQGQPLNDAWVRVLSLNPSNPMDLEVPVVSGSYRVGHCPYGVQLSVTARKNGHTPRTRLVTVLPNQTTTLDFGTPLDAYDPDSSPYFLSGYPEITDVEPAMDATLDAPHTLTYTLSLSEPLDLTHRTKLARALRVLPVNREATPGLSGGQELFGLPATEYRESQAPYAIREGTTFLDAFESRATVSWDETGSVATMRFPAPLIAARAGRARYQVVLTASEGPIRDRDGLPLGTDAAGHRDRYPADPLQVVNHAFREPAMTLSREAFEASPFARWAGTHTHAAPFYLPDDATAPAIEGVSARVIEGETRLTLRFSEPLAAFDGTKSGYRQADLLALDRFTFAVAETPADLEQVTLSGEGATPLASATTEHDRRSEFRLADDGGVTARLDPTDPAIAHLTIDDNGRFFASRIRAIKARVEGLADPAGNAISETAADAGVKSGWVER